MDIKEFIEPKQMALLLRKKFYSKKDKQADLNADDLDRRVMHLLDQTTEDEDTSGAYNNTISYGPRCDTVTRNYTAMIQRLVNEEM